MIYTEVHATVSDRPLRAVISNRLVITGYVTTLCSGRVPYEGPLERDFIERLDFNPRVKLIRAQSVRVQFRDEGVARKYTSDIYVEYHSSGAGPPPQPGLFEVKPWKRLRSDIETLRPGFIVASALCRSRNWRFRIATDRIIARSDLASIKFLRKYRIWPDPTGQAEALLVRLREARQLRVSRLLGDVFPDENQRLTAIGVLWHLAATRAVGLDLRLPLTMETNLWALDHGQ